MKRKGWCRKDLAGQEKALKPEETERAPQGQEELALQGTGRRPKWLKHLEKERKSGDITKSAGIYDIGP